MPLTFEREHSSPLNLSVNLSALTFSPLHLSDPHLLKLSAF